MSNLAEYGVNGGNADVGSAVLQEQGRRDEGAAFRLKPVPIGDRNRKTGIRQPDSLQALPPVPTLAIAPHLLQPETWVSG